MPIELITGLIGHGKTLLAVTRMRDDLKAGVRVYHTNINGLTLDVPQWDFEKWAELPPGSKLYVDEVHKFLPVRGRTQPPKWIEDLAEHRHWGLDFVFLTQDPMSIDSFVRRRVDRHWHIIRKFGTRFATIHEFASGVNEQCLKTRKGSIRHEWRFPKDVFSLYRSAELHTVKTRIPARVFALAAIPFVLLAGGWFLVHRLYPADSKDVQARLSTASTNAPGAISAEQLGASAAAAAAGLGGYLESHRPRIAGLPHTAPVYDGVTAPAVAPYPAACVASSSRCRCYSQQATTLDMPEDLCRSLASGGFFLAWRADGGRVDARPAAGPYGGPAVPSGALPTVPPALGINGGDPGGVMGRPAPALGRGGA